MSLAQFAEHNRVNWVGVRPGHYGEQIIKSAYTDNSEDTIYEVPDGYTFFLNGYQYIIRRGSAGTIYVNIYDEQPTLIAELLHLPMIANSVLSGGVGLYFPIELNEGWKITNKSTNSDIQINTCIWGFLVDNNLL